MMDEAKPEKLCKFEIELLAEYAEGPLQREWGAAVGVALGYLQRNDYIDSGRVTAKGETILAEWHRGRRR